MVGLYKVMYCTAFWAHANEVAIEGKVEQHRFWNCPIDVTLALAQAESATLLESKKQGESGIVQLA